MKRLLFAVVTVAMTLFGEPIVLGLSIDDVSVVPEQPTTLDNIVINSSGLHTMDNFVFEDWDFSQTDNLLQIDIIWTQYSPSNTVMTGWWHSAGIGVLPADTYELTVQTINTNPDFRWMDDAYTTSFEVVPEPTTICLLGLGVLGLLRKRRT